ncbi:MAG: leucine--tRNA ligase [Candidatus Zambryskibacteria bacterium CG10_big_fil_rev_8_21_14_0_10_34_34]|uniref:Leucine--tRNA ligase n=1 Tax=Candidatus Zambryskibacteria bacterium CG10_big_fil_rev_8_21_14_0_10_34_34 TaxID=1975114 RepID=A0A2H0R0M3_9BACT|nr:MAG: leucine--tRNA ligase [Candidatus Zambryskibacteria bacterium CG10_big_fil_rev_8_21_14_0_10_34_34]
MEKEYNHREIETKWQKFWKENKFYETKDQDGNKPNFYALVEFPYPSGNLHIGHWYAFAVPDIFVRAKRMGGYNVMFPIGFDAFGLPAENAAIKNKVDPRKWTYENIAYMEKQLQSMGNSFDWSRKVITSDPEYYKWTQWLFLKLYEKGLAYKKKAIVNWCPSCNTVLANEQVVAGKCERCDREVIQKDLEQWFFKITDYAERLLSDMENLNWPEEIKTAQKNWIGKSDGTELEFEVASSQHLVFSEKIKVFTTRADTLFGVTYLVLAPEHPIIEKLKSKIENLNEVEKYIKETKAKTEIERTDAKKKKTGIKLEGIVAINPVISGTGREVPIFVADYVLGNYGTGAVMAVPAHDERDFEFAKKYNLEIREVISGGNISVESYTGEGVLINSREFDGINSEEAREKITEKFGEKVTKYKLRDWLLSRQRYWGCPIPIVYDSKGKPHPIPEENLPWLLPEDIKDFAPKGESPLGSSKELKKRVEKIFGSSSDRWKPEVDTMDTFVDSSWYFNRYTDSKNEKEFANKEKLKLWMPVSRYSGGAEHTNMHLLYSRFFHKALFDLGLVNESEPFIKRMNRGLILGPDGQKMSKSKGNVIDPDEMVKKVGSDTVKMYLAFIGPYNETGQYPWDFGGIVGIRRFLERVWKIVQKIEEQDTKYEIREEKSDIKTSNSKLIGLLHKTIKKVTEDIENYKFNTAISAMMIFLNELEHIPNVSKTVFDTFLKLLAPFAPHITEEIWTNLRHKTSIHLEKWPEYDESKIKEENTVIAIQINGKVRGQLEIKTEASEETVKERALKSTEIQKWLGNNKPKKVIFVPNRIINFVI